jgi:hypothetical protein
VEQRFHDALAANVARGATPDHFAGEIFVGIEAGRFWLTPDAGFIPMVQQRTEEIAEQRNPAVTTQIDC